MPKAPLSKSNPYLREAADLKAVLRNSVITSTAIEGVHGVHLMAVNWEEAVPVLVRESGLERRPRPRTGTT